MIMLEMLFSPKIEKKNTCLPMFLKRRLLFILLNHLQIFMSDFDFIQQQKSSTFRELIAIANTIKSKFKTPNVSNTIIYWQTDSGCTFNILNNGSRIQELQSLAIDICILK